MFEEIYERSEGNAFLTEELLAASTGPGDLPDSVRDAMLVRLERLSEPAQQIVRVAAATGRRVDHRLLTAVAGVDEQTLFGALREAVAAQVLVPDQSDRSYEFRHALLRETAYDDLLPGERGRCTWPWPERSTSSRTWVATAAAWRRRWPTTGSPPTSSIWRCRLRSPPVARR